MSDACNRTPFWQRQPLLPVAIHEVLRERLEAALADPAAREGLVWPTILGAPSLRGQNPEGLPEDRLLAHAARLLAPLGCTDPAAAWQREQTARPDTALAGPDGWLPGTTWGAWGPLVSLRCGWTLAALTPLAPGAIYPLACGVSLFNHGLYHECHDALEPLWGAATSPLQEGLQGLILMAGGYHHLQQHNRSGLLALWEEARVRLEACEGIVGTPWGQVRAEVALDLTLRRLDEGRRMTDDSDLAPLWALDRPTWELA